LHTGSCLCGAVRYEIAGDLAPIQLCHCQMCRRASGAAFAANMPVRAADFRVVAGEASLKSYRSGPEKERLFCADCGSPIISRTGADPDWVRVRVGGLDEPVDARPAFHFHVASKATSLPISDGLPQYPNQRPS
jgi:hypothetical protein